MATEINIPTHLKFIVRFYKICRYFGTTAYTPNSKHFIPLLIVSLYLVFVVLLIAFTLLKFKLLISSSTKSAEFLSEYLQIAAPILSHLVITIETIWKRDYDRKIIKRITIIENYDFSNFLKFDRKFIILCVSVHLVGFGTEMYTVLSVGEKEHRWRLSICIRILTFIIGRMLLLQYILLVNYVKYKLNYLEFNLLNSSGVQQIRRVRKVYTNLWKLLITINYRFGYSLMSLILSLFFCDVVAVYWVCVRLRFRKLTVITASSLTALPPTMTLIVLYVYAQSFNDQMVSFKTKLHSIFEYKLNHKTKSTHNVKILKMINLISLGVLQMKLTLNICGCMVLGYDQFQEVLASLIQYLFIFISFSGF